VVETCECGNEPSCSINAGNFLTSCKPVNFLRKIVLHAVSDYTRNGNRAVPCRRAGGLKGNDQA
jgi:hypothetical protein